MISVQKPTSDAMAAPIPFLKNFSINMPSNTAPQPTKTADEYRFVTGGRPEYTSARVVQKCVLKCNTSTQKAALASSFGQPKRCRRLKDQHVELHRNVEWLEGIEDAFVVHARNIAREVGNEAFA